ncbi:hypothetical protein LB505_008796 [Fusarium chuoi]|nr:hypothetical protein LB505_008796 [Fusarium chuoi]
MSKGGRMSTGHMVEVRLNTTYVGVGGQTSIGPQHPILYWVNKRPYCDEFLRRVCKWYNLVVFTASVQDISRRDTIASTARSGKALSSRTSARSSQT